MLYKHCRVFVIPSSTEGFCLPLAEALHFSDRVVCSDIPIFQEVGTSKCTYFSLQGDVVDNLTNAIMQSLSQPKHDSSNYSDRFNKWTIAQQYLALYHKVKLASKKGKLKPENFGS